MVHNMNDRAYIHIKSEIKYSKMDIGNFVSRTEYAKQIKLDNTYAQSDWKYVVEYLKAFRGDIVYIPKTLYVHN
jgi:hypothetical protein